MEIIRTGTTVRIGGAVICAVDQSAFMRILIYTGKGGVGKTSVSVATAIKCAERGLRTIVISTDSAHSLSDSVDVAIGPSIKNIAKNLDGLEIDILKELEENWNDIRKYIFSFFASQGMDEISAKEMAVFPGMEFIAALFYLGRFYSGDEYDVVVVDTAPTADTLRLLSFPDVADWYFQHFYGLMKNFIRVARVTVGRVVSIPLPPEEVMREFERFNLRIKSVRKLLTNPEITSVRLVTNPEKMVISETMRAYTYLSLYDLNVEALIVNRVHSKNPLNTNEGKIREQENYIEMIESAFHPLKIFYSKLFPLEIVGLESVKRLGDELFGDTDPSVIFSRENPLKIVSKRGNTSIQLKVPFANRNEVELYTTRDTIVVGVGQYRRTIALPLGLYGREVESAEISDGVLKIKFREDSDAGGKEKRPAGRKGKRGY